MLRTIVIAGAAAIAGYIIGVRAGFDAGVRDYLENSGRLLRQVASEKDKFNTDSNGELSEEEVDEIVDEVSSGRSFQ